MTNVNNRQNFKKRFLLSILYLIVSSFLFLFFLGVILGLFPNDVYGGMSFLDIFKKVVFEDSIKILLGNYLFFIPLFLVSAVASRSLESLKHGFGGIALAAILLALFLRFS